MAVELVALDEGRYGLVLDPGRYGVQLTVKLVILDPGHLTGATTCLRSRTFNWSYYLS